MLGGVKIANGEDTPPPDPRFVGAAQARIDASYAVVLFENGTRSMYPLSELTGPDRTWLQAFAEEHPLHHGNSKVQIAATVVPVKQTIEVSKTDGAIEKVQLCQPGVIRTQDGPFCALFAMVHCLDIAGYIIKPGSIEEIQNHANAINRDDPWADPTYSRSIDHLVQTTAAPGSIHEFNHQLSQFDWIRAELRKGRPVAAAFPEEIWRALPPEYIAAIRGWDGGKVGHAIVINGFTYNSETNKGSFHIVNSWQELQQFDLTTDAAKNLLSIYFSISPKGSKDVDTPTEHVVSVTLVGSSGQTKLYKVETNLGVHRVAAPSEDEARALFEAR